MRQSEKKKKVKSVQQPTTAAFPEQGAKGRQALLALQHVLRVCTCLCGHRACWHQVRSLSQAKGAQFGTIYFVFFAWSKPWSKLPCQLCSGFLLEETRLLTQKGAWKGPGIPAVRVTGNQGWGTQLINNVEAPWDSVLLLYKIRAASVTTVQIHN